MNTQTESITKKENPRVRKLLVFSQQPDNVNVSTNLRTLTNNIPIFRFNFSPNFVTKLSAFSTDHGYDDRHTFKREWNKWVSANNQLIRDEVNHMTSLGYVGDCVDKMYKSARYYFKKPRPLRMSEKPDVVRHPYTRAGPHILRKIDSHILSLINSNSESFTPKFGYELFIYSDHPEIIQEMSDSLSTSGGEYTREECIDKIKKTYKNRYVILTKKN